MNENINLVEILKNCPIGTKLWSPVCGEVTLKSVYPDIGYCIYVITEHGITESFTKYGAYFKNYEDIECLLFPSKENRDWSKFKYPKPKFDPSTLSPFDKVLARETNDDRWILTHFGYIKYYVGETMIFGFSVTNGAVFRYCIPYNEETKHLIGTKEEEPQKYKWIK